MVAAHVDHVQFVETRGAVVEFDVTGVAEQTKHVRVGSLIGRHMALNAAAALAQCPYHEYQPTVFDRGLGHVDTAMRCERCQGSIGRAAS